LALKRDMKFYDIENQPNVCVFQCVWETERQRDREREEVKQQ